MTITIRLFTVELESALQFAKETDSMMIEIDETPTGIGSKMIVRKILSGTKGWEKTDVERDVSDYDSW